MVKSASVRNLNSVVFPLFNQEGFLDLLKARLNNVFDFRAYFDFQVLIVRNGFLTRFEFDLNIYGLNFKK
jgi:hypothetical protein